MVYLLAVVDCCFTALFVMAKNQNVKRIDVNTYLYVFVLQPYNIDFSGQKHHCFLIDILYWRSGTSNTILTKKYLRRPNSTTATTTCRKYRSKHIKKTPYNKNDKKNTTYLLTMSLIRLALLKLTHMCGAKVGGHCRSKNVLLSLLCLERSIVPQTSHP